MKKRLFFTLILVLSVGILFSIIYHVIGKKTLEKRTIICVREYDGKNVVMGENLYTKEKSVLLNDKDTTYEKVGKYVSGDYCCSATNGNGDFLVYLLKDKKIVKEITLDSHPDDIVVGHDILYYQNNNYLYFVDLNTEKEVLIFDNLATKDNNYKFGHNLFISNNDTLIFLVSTCLDSFELRAYKDGSIVRLCEIMYPLGFATDNEFVFIGSDYDRYIVNIDSKKMSRTLKYQKCCAFVYPETDGKHFDSFYMEHDNDFFPVLNVSDSAFPFRFSSKEFDESNTPLYFAVCDNY